MTMLSIVGIGPGDSAYRSAKANQALQDAELICGYQLYIDLIREEFVDKEFYTTGMTQERERCIYALEQAQSGKQVAMICSGDAGIYGMAGLLYELSADYPQVELLVVPGITAALAGAALLGSPLSNDFAVISLSDQLSPWEQIARRLDGAARADLVLCLYNPRSRQRPDNLRLACDIVLRHADPDTPCGIARQIGRADEGVLLMSLRQLRNYEADMFCTVFIGNSQTRQLGGKLVTLRGYRHDG